MDKGHTRSAWPPHSYENIPFLQEHYESGVLSRHMVAQIRAIPPLMHKSGFAVSGHCRYATALHGQYRGRTASQHQHSRDSETLHRRETVRELLTHSDNDPLQTRPLPARPGRVILSGV